MKQFFKDKWDYLWLFVAIITSGFLSYGIFTDWVVALTALLVLVVLLLIINDFEVVIYLILLSIVAGQLLRVGIAEYGGSVIASDLIIILVAGIWLIRKLIRRERIKNTPINILLLIFIIFAIISLLFSLNLILPEETLKASFYLIRFIAYALIFYISLDFVKNQSVGRKYLNWIFAITVIIAILGFIQLIYVPDFAFMTKFGWDPHQNRLLSTFFDPNFVGGFFGFVLSLIMGIWFLSSRKKQKSQLVVLGLIIFIALALTFSRSAYLGFIVSFIIVTLMRSWKITLIGLLIIMIGFLASPRAIDRVKDIWEGDESASARVESWKQGWEIIKSHPIVGVGYNTLPYIKPIYDFSEQDEVAHSAGGIDSSILTIWATTGIMGLLSYLAIYGLIVWQSFKVYLDQNQSQLIRGFGLGLGAALAGLFVHSQFVNSLLFSPIMILLWLCAGTLFALSGTRSLYANRN